MRMLLSAAMLAVLAVPAAAQAEEQAAPAAASAPSVKAGQRVFYSTGRRLGTIDRVLPNGDVRVISDMKMVSVPSSSLSLADQRLVTSLTPAEVSRQR